MLKYLGVTTNPDTDEIQIICATDAEAQELANDLAETFSLGNEKRPRVDGYKITYRGHIMSLKYFLTSRKWKLTMDTQNRFMFDRPEEEQSSASGQG
jgi:hypothetical protein